MKNGHIKIERGIPMPLTTRSGRGKSEFTIALEKIKPGESFFIERDPARVYRHIHMWRHYDAARKKLKFTTRVEGKGTRVWRVE